MLQLEISGGRLFDEETSRFIITPAVTLQLEHSLLSLSKWESEHCKPFVNAKDLTDDELMDYIICMSELPITRVDLVGLRDEHLEKLQAYLENPHTATTINSPKSRGELSNHHIRVDLLLDGGATDTIRMRAMEPQSAYNTYPGLLDQ